MSNNWLFNASIFAIGAAVGSVVTWKYIKTKYEQLAQEEIESVREVYDRHTEDLEKQSSKTEKELMQAYQDIVEGYIEVDRSVEPKQKPHVISPEELGDCDYEVISLTYYADGILADDNNEPIEDVDDVVGTDSLTCFGQYEDDAVHVRNDARKIDYEILASAEIYIDVVNKNPRFTEGE